MPATASDRAVALAARLATMAWPRLPGSGAPRSMGRPPLGRGRARPDSKASRRTVLAVSGASAAVVEQRTVPGATRRHHTPSTSSTITWPGTAPGLTPRSAAMASAVSLTVVHGKWPHVRRREGLLGPASTQRCASGWSAR